MSTTHKTGNPAPKKSKWRSCPWGSFLWGSPCIQTAAFCWNALWTEGWGNRCYHGPHPFITFRNVFCTFCFFRFFTKNWKSFIDREARSGNVYRISREQCGVPYQRVGNKNWTQTYTTGIGYWIYWMPNIDLKCLNIYTLGHVPALIRVSIYWAFSWTWHSNKPYIQIISI